ncbi:hypothetical protein D3C78_20920 [compost metagenome]
MATSVIEKDKQLDAINVPNVDYKSFSENNMKVIIKSNVAKIVEKSKKIEQNLEL